MADKPVPGVLEVIDAASQMVGPLHALADVFIAVGEPEAAARIVEMVKQAEIETHGVVRKLINEKRRPGRLPDHES